MSRIYRLTDRIKYKIGEIEIGISPLSVEDKSILNGYALKAASGDAEALWKGSAQAIKMALKSITGVEDADGKPYELQFEENGRYLTDECVNEIMNISETSKMISICSALLAGIPSKLPEGVSLVEEKPVPNSRKGKK